MNNYKVYSGRLHPYSVAWIQTNNKKESKSPHTGAKVQSYRALSTKVKKCWWNSQRNVLGSPGATGPNCKWLSCHQQKRGYYACMETCRQCGRDAWRKGENKLIDGERGGEAMRVEELTCLTPSCGRTCLGSRASRNFIILNKSC